MITTSRQLLLTCLLIALHWSSIAQTSLPEFSPLSGRANNQFTSAALGGYYYYQLLLPTGGVSIYKINDAAEIVDSVSISQSIGTLKKQDNQLLYFGINWDGNPFTTCREAMTQFDPQLNITNQTDGPLVQPIYAPIVMEQTSSITNTRSGDYCIYQDTILSFNKYLLVDSPQVFLGSVNVFMKMGTDGTFYGAQPLNINALHNCFFVKNHLIVQGSADLSPFNPKALVEFDSDGQLLRGIDYDSYGSGEFLDGALGGWHNNRYYFSYLGYDPTVPGCASANATIDVRDSSWTVLHRFKLPDCDYNVSGKMPFSFDAQDNVYYVAPHESYKKLMVYKYSPDFQMLWKIALDFADDPLGIYYPLSQEPTPDGGILLNCKYFSSSIQSLVIFRLSPDGVLLSSTQLQATAQANTLPPVFPNPTPGPVNLPAEFPQDLTVQVYRPDGTWISTLEAPNQQIDLSAYPAGAYLLSFRQKGQPNLLSTQIVIKNQR